jgi:hypothetical protein
MRVRIGFAVVLTLLVSSVFAQSSRELTRSKLRTTLDAAGKLPDVRATFRPSEKEPFNFIATMTDGLVNAESLEVVIRVTENDTINFRVYPHYDGGYINLDKVKNRDQLMRTMLLFSDHNFLFWGVDDEKDAFSGYTVTLESGFPAEGIQTVLRSIRNTDKFVGRLRPFIDGTAAAAQ